MRGEWESEWKVECGERRVKVKSVKWSVKKESEITMYKRFSFYGFLRNNSSLSVRPYITLIPHKLLSHMAPHSSIVHSA